MIYTLTCNPSLDYIATVKEFQEGVTNRTTEEIIYPGGKGINVSAVLKNLGYESTALGFTAGFTGEELQRLVGQLGIQTRFIPVKHGATRINVKISSGKETEINGMGPAICKEELQMLYEQIDTIKTGDMLIIAGSIPAMLPDSLYQEIAERIKDRDICLVVDTEGEALLKVLPYHPFLIKPNKAELEKIFGVTIEGRDAAVEYARMLQEMGAKNVMVSLGAEGAVCITESGGIYQAKAPQGKLVHSVGAGDAMVAGFLAGYLDVGSYEEAFWMGLCTGSASAFSPGFATREDVMDLMGRCMNCQ